MRAVGSRALVIEQDALADHETLDIADRPAAAGRPERRTVSDPRPAAQIRTLREAAPLFVVLLNARAPVVEAEPSTASDRHGRRESRRETIPARFGCGEDPALPCPADTVGARSKASLGSDRTGRERVAARVKALGESGALAE